MTHSVDRESIRKLFGKFTNKYGKLWTARLGDNGDWKSCEDDWYEELSQFTLGQVITAAKKAFSLYPEFPPTQPQIIALCLKESGLPCVDEVIKLMVGRDFNHPVVKMVFDKIGSWAISNGKEHEINSKAKEFYANCVADFQESPKIYWERLKSYNEKPKELPVPSKIPSAKELRGFKERWAEYEQLANQEKEKEEMKDVAKREFDYSKLNRMNRDFDINLFNEYKTYLLEVPDNLILSLSPRDCYERTRFMGEREQPEYLRKSGYNSNSLSKKQEPLKSSSKNYKNWMND